MTLYVTFVLQDFDEIEVIAPKLVPVASTVGFIAFISAIIAFWPVWGWYTPCMMFVMMMGYLMAGSFMPKGQFGSIVFLMVFIGSVFSSRFIAHQGLLHE
jgi:hypothetical protein